MVLTAEGQDIIDALKYIDENGVPFHNQSTKYELVSGGLNNFFLYLTICCYKLLIQQLFFLLLPKSY